MSKEKIGQQLLILGYVTMHIVKSRIGGLYHKGSVQILQVMHVEANRSDSDEQTHCYLMVYFLHE